MREIDTFCTGCDVCRHCGRNKNVIHYSCDSCRDADNIDGETVIYSDDGHFYCLPCLVRKHMDEFIEWAVDNLSEQWADENFFHAPESEDE